MVASANQRLPQRVRNTLRFRQIHVVSKTKIAGKFWRIRFSGTDLAGFTSPGFDDHIKVFFPSVDGATLALPEMTDEGIVWPEGLRPQARDYTPLEFDGESSLTLDFYIHQQGVASDWATQAQAGDQLIVGGPRGSLVVPTDYAFQLYVCDETGLPAFARRQRDVSAQALHLYAFTDETTGCDYLSDTANVTANWLGSGQMQHAQLSQLIIRLDQITLPAEDYFIWLTGEGEFVKALSDYFTVQRGLNSDFVRAAAYWHLKKAVLTIEFCLVADYHQSDFFPAGQAMKQYPNSTSSDDQTAPAGSCSGRRKRREKMLEASEIRLLMLHFLAQNAAHGYELIKSVEELSKGEYSPSPGIIYPNLTLLEEMEAIEVVDAQATRKAYRLTAVGEAQLAESKETVSSLITRLSTLAILVNNRSIPAVEQAIHGLKVALNRRLAQEDISEAALQTLIKALQDAAKKITHS